MNLKQKTTSLTTKNYNQSNTHPKPKPKHYKLPLITTLLITTLLITILLVTSYFSTTNQPTPNIPTINPPYTTPQLLWNTNTDSDIISTSPTVANGLIYTAADNHGKITAMNTTNGNIIWTARTGFYTHIGGSLPVANNIIYALTSEFYALNITNGNTLWTYPCGGGTSPIVINNIIYISAISSTLPTTHVRDTAIFALNAGDGAELWHYVVSIGECGVSSPAVANGVVYVSCSGNNSLVLFDNFVYALDALTGSVLWKSTIGGSAHAFSDPVVVNGVVYVGSSDHKIYALNAETGKKIWSATLDGDVGSPTVEYGAVYVCTDKSVYALNATNGKKIWNYTINGYVATPAIADGVVYLLGYRDNSVFHALSAANGETLWSYTIPIRPNVGTEEASPIVVDDTVYVCSDRNVYAFSTIKPLNPP
jgi:outer membrane protein assembly factor BamB